VGNLQHDQSLGDGARHSFGVHRRILQLIEQNVRKPSFRTGLSDPRVGDPMFLLHRLLNR
jgi:hypothetical protein